MTKDILDFIEDEENDKTNRLLRFLPLIVISIGVIFTFFAGHLSSIQHLLGSIGVLLTILVLLIDFKKGVFVNGVVLLLGCINLISFYPLEIVIGPSINGFRIGIDIIITAITSFFLHYNMDEFKPQFRSIFYGNEQLQEEEMKFKVEKFKNRFRNKSLKELQEIAKNKALTEEAKTAAIEMIREIDSLS